MTTKNNTLGVQFDVNNVIEVSTGLVDALEAATALDGDMHPVEMLALAEKLIAEAKRSLNTDSTPCTECGVNHFADFSQYKAADRLGGAITRVQDIIRTNPWDSEPTNRSRADEPAKEATNGKASAKSR